MIKVNWVFQSDYKIDPTLDVESMKSSGPFWGSWKTWRSCGTDNVICHDFAKARELINRRFHEQCNFYIPQKNFQSLERPSNTILYDGDFERDVNNIEDIIACHLSSSQSEIVLLVGFDFSKLVIVDDPYQNHKSHNYQSLMHSIIKSQSSIQWVLIDHDPNISDRFQNLTNLTCDTMENVLKLLIQ